MDVLECIETRRSTRSFTDEAVGREQLERIVRAGLYAPSAMNEQPWLFTVVTDKAVLAALNGAVKAYMSQSDIERISSRAADSSFCFYYNAPALIIVSSADVLYPAQDCACALENMFLAAHALGLGSCWINQLCGVAGDSAGVRAVLDGLGVPVGHKVYGCAAIGHIGTPTPVKERRGTVNWK